MEITEIPGWQKMDPFQRTVASFAYNCRARIVELQSPVMRTLTPPPIILDRSDNDALNLQLVFPVRNLVTIGDTEMDTITFIVGKNPANPMEAEFHAVFMHGDCPDKDFDNPTSSFGLALTQDMLEWDGKARSSIVPSHKLTCEITTIDERNVVLDAEDWFDSCLWQAAASPRKMQRPKVMDLLEPPEEAAIPV